MPSGSVVKKKKPSIDGWCFAIVNGRLAELFFKKGPHLVGHAYIQREGYSKREQKMIDEDVKKCVFTYRNGYYYDRIKMIKIL